MMQDDKDGLETEHQTQQRHVTVKGDEEWENLHHKDEKITVFREA